MSGKADYNILRNIMRLLICTCQNIFSNRTKFNLKSQYSFGVCRKKCIFFRIISYGRLNIITFIRGKEREEEKLKK